MKKNKMMRLASCLLVMVLLTTSMISGTFAKYVSEGTGSDSARVAKWGVIVTANTTDGMFEKEYTNGSSVTVLSETEVVAPGTEKQDFTDLVVSGTPEVATEVTYNANLVLTGWGDYCPIIFYVETKSFKIGDDGINNTEDLEEAVEAAIVECKATYPANAEINNGDAAPTIGWSWPFSTSNANDVKDTALGNNAADAAVDAATISLEVKATATQVD